MSDDQLRHEMGEAARAATSRFTPSVIDEKWQALYKSLLEQAKLVPNRLERNAARFAESIKQLRVEELADVAGSDMDPDLLKPNTSKGSHKVLENSELQFQAAGTRNRLIVDSILSDAKVPAYEIRGFHAYRTILAVRDTDRSEIFTQLAARDDDEMVVDFLPGKSSKNSYRWRPAADSLPANFVEADVIRIYGSYSDAYGLTTVGSESAVDIEFWSRDDESNLFAAPRPNKLIDSLEDDDFADSKKLEQPPADVWSSVNFPIDVVYTWVNGNDPVWAAKKAKYLSDAHGFMRRPQAPLGSRTVMS